MWIQKQVSTNIGNSEMSVHTLTVSIEKKNHRLMLFTKHLRGVNSMQIKWQTP